VRKLGSIPTFPCGNGQVSGAPSSGQREIVGYGNRFLLGRWGKPIAAICIKDFTGSAIADSLGIGVASIYPIEKEKTKESKRK